MYLTTKILYSLCLFIIFLWTVNGTIEILNRHRRVCAVIEDREIQFYEDTVMEGFIATTDPSDACSDVKPPPFLTNFSDTKFALINGSNTCGYKDKIKNAANAGFDFAIIFDPIGTIFTYLDSPIPAVLISLEDGLIIKNRYLFNVSSDDNYRIKVKSTLTDFKYYMYLFYAVIALCFFVMIVFMMCLLIKCIQERRKSRRNRLSSRQIKQIPTAKFSKGDQYDVCAICLEDYNEGDKLRILPCSHAYHAKCIDPWLINNRRNCPLCKRKITFGDSGDESDSEDSELTSPAENTPLLTSPSNHGQSWGTFVNPVHTADTGEPSLASDNYSSLISNSRQHAFYGSAIGNQLMSDSESENLLPPSHFSVNKEEAVGASNQVEVQVNFNNHFQGETSSNHTPSV